AGHDGASFASKLPRGGQEMTVAQQKADAQQFPASAIPVELVCIMASFMVVGSLPARRHSGRILKLDVRAVDDAGAVEEVLAPLVGCFDHGKRDIDGGEVVPGVCVQLVQFEAGTQVQDDCCDV